MKRRSFYIGPGAASLLLVIVVVSMSILGLLALMSAQSDVKLMARSRDFVSAEYETSARAERRLAELDGVVAECAQSADADADFLSSVAQRLPDGMRMRNRTVTWIESSETGRDLNCAVRVSELGEAPRLTWEEHLFASEGEGDFSE